MISRKWGLFIILLVLLFGAGSVHATELDNTLNKTISADVDIVDDYEVQSNNVLQSNDADSVYNGESDEIEVGDWEEIQYYSSLKDKNYVLKLKENTNYYPVNASDSSYQILFNNNVTVIGAQGAYIGDVSPNASKITYTAMKVPDNNGVGITFKNVTFKWIATRYQPDGVFLQMGGNSINSFENCYFTNISTDLGHSSIVHIKIGDAIVKNCTFVNCTTDFGCLSVYNPSDDPTGTCLGARMNVSDSYFEGNYARTEPGCINNCGVLIVTNSTFNKNSAFWWAGAIHTHGGANTTIYDSDFIDNLAGWNGGALYTYSYLQIYNSRFIGNNCTTNNGGGAIGACKYLHAPYIRIEDSLFMNNENLCWGLDELSTTGTGRGGAISLMDEGGLEVYNSTFIRNSASIGTAICAINGGLSYGSPDVKIIGNKFINHTRVGDVLDVRVATGSTAEIRDNYFENNSIVFSKLKLSADDPINGRVMFHIDAALKNPNSYDQDILDNSNYDVYVDGVYKTTVSSRDFDLNLGKGNTAHVYVVPCISNSKSNEVFAGIAKTFIYVSQSRGNDNNDGSTRTKAVKTLNKSIELARSTENIIIMDGTFKETNLVIDYNLTIVAEKNVAITVTGNGFIISDGDVKFENITFKNCKYGSNTKNRLISQTGTGFFILNGCVFDSNDYKNQIEASGNLECENIIASNNKDGSIIRADSIVIKSSKFIYNTVTYSLYKGIIMYKTNSKMSKFEAENLTFIGNTVHTGCILLAKAKTTVNDCTFIGNTAISSGRASAICVEDSGSVLVQSCLFINNTDTGNRASVIYPTSGTVLMKDSILINNTYVNTNNLIIDGNDAQLKKLSVNSNWWGNTPDNLTKPNIKEFNPNFSLPDGWYPAQYLLVLNATALSNEIELNERIPVQFIFTQIDREGNVTSYDGVNIPDFDLVLTAVNGTCSNQKITVKNGMGLTYFTLTQMSSASLTGSFNGIESTINFTFKKTTPELSIDVDDIKVGNTAEIVVNVPSDATGTVILKVGNITKNTTISNSRATFSIPDLPAGSYDIEANYTGNAKYNSVVETSNFTVNKNNSTIKISAGAIELNKEVIFTFTISDGATGTVDVYVNDNKETIDVGQTYTIHNISRGDYIVRAVYSGDSYYLESEDEYSFEVAKLTPTITVIAPDITYGADTIVNVDLNNDATGSVVVTIDGKSNTSQLNGGKASVSISGINAGADKVIDVYYSGDNNYKNATTTKTYNVGKANLDFTINSNNIKLGQNAVITIQLPARSGGTLTIAGIKSETRNIPLTGLVTLTYSDLTVGTYTVSVQYDGDNYQTISKSTTFEVSDWDVPQWPNEGYDVKNTEKSPYTSETNGNVKWIKDIGGTIIGNLAIDSEGRIYVVADGIYSINPNDGSTNWIFNSQDAGEAFSGIAISRDTVLAPKSSDKLYFINQTIGEQYHNNIYQGSSAFAPIVDENANIYVSGEYYGFESTKVVVIPYRIWQTSTAPTSIEIGDYEITSSPVLVTDNICIFTTNTALMGIDLSSKSIILNTPVVSNSRPVAGPGNLIYLISNGHVLGYNAQGTKIKDVEITGVSGNYLSVGEYGEIYSINKEGKLFDYSGDEETLIYDFNDTISSRLLVGQDGNLYVGSESGMLYSIDTDGNLLWKVNLNQSITNAPIMDKNGVIYVVSGNRLIAIDNASLKDSNLTAEIRNVTYGENVTVNIELDELATGIVSIKVADKYVNESVNTNGKISFTIPGLTGGNYTAEISYAGDNRFNSKQIVVKFSVGKINPTMNVDFNNIKVGEALQINVADLPIDSTGLVTVSIGGKSNSSNVLNGNANLFIYGLAKGEYPFTVTYTGDVNYNEKSITKSLSVGYVPASFDAQSGDINAGDDVNITVTGLPEDADGVVYVNCNGRNYTDFVIGGNASIIIPDLTEGYYNFDVMYVNSTKYSADQRRVSVNVSKITPTFNVTVGNVDVGKNIVVDVSGLPTDATGLVIASIEDLSINVSIGNGQAKIIIPQNLTAGTYAVEVTYAGDNRYNKISQSKPIKISKITPEFTICLTDNINVWDDVVVDISGLPLDAYGKINVSLVGYENSSDISNGRSTVIIHQKLVNGTYPVEIVYFGNYKYNSFNETRFVNITKVASKMTVKLNSEINVGDDLIIDISGLPKDTTEHYIDIIGGIVNKGLIKEGTSNMVISNLTSGSYSFTVSFRGDDKYEPVQERYNVNVNKISVSMNVTADNIDVGENLIIQVKLPKDIHGEYLYISINDDENPVMINNGTAIINISGLTKGTYNYTITFNGNEKYESASYENIVGVDKMDIDFNATIKDISYGQTAVVDIFNLPDDALGSVIVIVNNEQYKSNVSGSIASLKISDLYPGVYTAEIRYSDDKYMSNSKLISFNVGKITPSCNIVAEDISVGDELQIIVTLPMDATGYVTVKVDNSSQIVKLINGVASAEISGLTAGAKTVEVDYEGDNVYDKLSDFANVTVRKVFPAIEISADLIEYGEDLIVRVNLPADATGNVTVNVGEKSKTVELERGSAITNISGLNAGNTSIDVHYNGDNKYDSVSDSKVVVVNKAALAISINADNIKYSQSLNVSVQLSKKIDGNVLISVGGINKAVVVSDGFASTDISGLSGGSHVIDVKFDGNSNYDVASASKTISVDKIAPEIIITADDIVYGDELNVVVALNNDINGFVSILVSGILKTVSVKEGIANCTFLNLTAGDKIINVRYDGDENYIASQNSKTIVVSKINPDIIISNNEIEYGQNLKVQIDLNKDAGGIVTVSVDDVSQIANIKDGSASVEFSNLTAGSKIITVKYSGDDNHDAVSNSKAITISKINPSMNVTTKDIKAGEELTVSVQINNKSTGNVIISVGDVSKTVPVKEGIAIGIIEGLNAGNYSVEVIYSGDGNFNNISYKTDVEVKPVTPAMDINVPSDIKAGESPVISLELPKDANGIVHVTLDGKVIGDVSVVNGTAKFTLENISSGNHTLNVVYSGDGKFAPLSKDVEISCNDKTKKGTVIIVVDKFTRVANDYSAGERGDFFYAVLQDLDGNPLVNKTVQIAVNGPIYEVQTDQYGRAGIRINLAAANTYTYALFFGGDSEYAATPLASSKLILTKKSTSITASAKTFNAKAKTKTVSVTLKTVKSAHDGKTYLKAGKKITLKVGGKTYTAKINSKGIAKFKIKLTKKGKYTAKIQFAGDQTYKASSKSIKITIK